MIDEKLIIEKLELLKNNAGKILKKPYMLKYISPDQFCEILDKIIEYINDIKIDIK